MERTPAGIRPIFSSTQGGPTNSQRQLLGRFLGGSASFLRGIAGSSGGGVRGGSGGGRGSVDSLASGSGGVSSGFLRGFDGFFLLGAAGQDEGGQGGGESDLRVH
jgi:hypothetical protein